MTERRRWIVTVATLAVTFLAFVQFWPGKTVTDRTTGDSSSTGDAADIVDQPVDSPFSTTDEPDTLPSPAARPTAAAKTNGRDTQPSDSDTGALEALASIDVSALGRRDFTDDAFNALVERLRKDPGLLQSLLDEFRQETDPERLRRLSQLLGEVGGSDVTTVASELVFSGDPGSRAIGLELLKHVQPGNADAREIVSGILATEIEASTLVDTLNAISTPGAVDADARAGLSEQVALLASHSDPAVRRSSLDILSRWSDDPRHTPVLLNGLTDTDSSVRETAAYSLVGHEDSSDEVIQDLLFVVNNEQEAEQTRRGAILALRGMPLSDTQRQQLVTVEKRLDRRP